MNKHGIVFMEGKTAHVTSNSLDEKRRKYFISITPEKIEKGKKNKTRKQKER